MDSPCKGVRSAVVTRGEYCMVTPFFWRLCTARRRNGEIPGVKTPYVYQAEHHRKFSYQEELRELLKRHRVAFDERYLWV